MSSSKHETIYWTMAKKDRYEAHGRKALWKTDADGNVVIIDFEPSYPMHMNNTRMTVADMDECPSCKRCRHDGLPLDSVEVSDAQ